MDYETLRTFRPTSVSGKGGGTNVPFDMGEGKGDEVYIFFFVSFRWVERSILGKRYLLVRCTRISLYIYLQECDHINGTSLAVGHIHRSPTHNNHYIHHPTSRSNIPTTVTLKRDTIQTSPLHVLQFLKRL